MTEFAFEGGYRGEKKFKDHYQDRQEGKVGKLGSALPLPQESTPYDEHSRASHVFSQESHDQQSIGRDRDRLDPVPEAAAQEIEDWDSGVRKRYRHSPRPVLCKKTPGYRGVRGLRSQPEQMEIRPGVTVWLELSKGGPYKVVGRYPTGAEVPAHHPHEADNVYEKVTVSDDLWLCQDGKGTVHILAGGSLTLTEPARWTASVRGAVAEIWSRREIALWVALSGMAAKVVLG